MGIIRENQGHQIHIKPEEYANGWVATVTVDGVVVQDDKDAPAMCVTREEALEQGERRAREYLQWHD